MTATVVALPRRAADQRAYRLTSIDMLRGLVIVIMAIDHVRDFFLAGAQQDPTADPNVSAALFATRWITHVCAPVFVLLAGTSAGLMAARRTPRDLGWLLFTRGVWLVAVECLIVSTGTTFAPLGIAEIDGATLVILQVIWAIGASMMVLAAVQWLGQRACIAIGLTIVAGHNLLDVAWPVTGGSLDQGWPLWVSLHAQMAVSAGPFLFAFIYPVLPWSGVMLLGFGIAPVFHLAPDQRNRILVRAGVGMSAAFLVLRALDVYGDPNGWQVQPGGTATIIDFLNTTKYPPSLAFLLMTLGPAAMVCGLADRIGGGVKDALITFGRVPFAFYVAHIYLIHALSVALGVAQGFTLAQMLTLFFFYPQGYGVGLPAVYAAWALVILLLYPFCRWVAAVKARRRDWWLSYL